MLKKSVKKIFSLLLTASMVWAVAGCGSGGIGGSATEGGNAETGANTGDQSQNMGKTDEGGPVAMGRYVEEEIDLSEQTGSHPMDICRRNDGSLVILCAGGIFVSEDEGATWKDETPEWYLTMKQADIYVSNIYMAPDGTVAVIYSVDTEDPQDYKQAMKLILPDGTEVPVEMELSEDEAYFKQVAVKEAGGDGIFFVSTYRSVYEVGRDGNYDKVLDLDYNPQWIWVKDNLLFIDSDWEELDMPVVYDMDAGEYVEDEVLREFVAQNYQDRNYNGSDYADMFLQPGEDKTVYVVGKKGIHRHVIGGNMMEQIVDGNLSLLSNPSYVITDMMQLEGDAFLILFANSKLIRFTYDPNIPAVPENMVTIYSLREDANIRQAISFYQMKHPDVFVSYKIGMGDDDSVTREDAVKKLNTEIMAGEGPDLLVMDELPLASYVEKRMLVDLTDYFARYSEKEPLFDNVIDALKCEDKAYVAPATIGIPQLAAKADGAENMTDLSDVAEVMETLRKEHPSGDILGICTERGILKRFAGTSAPRWIASGAIDRDTIGEYLEQCKRIFDIQMDGLDEKIRTDYQGWLVRMEEFWGRPEEEIDYNAYLGMTDYIGGTQQVISGWVNSEYSYVQMASLNLTKGFENTKVVPMQGQCSQVFKPQTMLGISAASAQVEEAKGFMDAFLSADVQGMYDGLPLNQKGYDIQFTPNEDYLGENGEYGSWATGSEDGTYISYICYWPSDEQIATFKAQLASLNTAYIPDNILEQAVFEQGTAYMRDEKSLEQALDEIEKAVAIYMAE